MNDAISPAEPTRLTKGKIVGIGRSQLNSFQSCLASAARFLKPVFYIFSGMVRQRIQRTGR